jgi:2-amino-4-hydroxy-6-hydroxymethyldihydropteridine diphosphokinase
MAEDLTPVAIALGSSLGDRLRLLTSALTHLSAIVTASRVSTFRETEAVGAAGDQPRYLNAAIAGWTTLDAHDLLRALQQIERAHGRERPYPNAPRTLDLDVILYGNEIIDTPELIVPHPRFRERAFVLEPLAEVAADFVDPVTGHTMAELWEAQRRTLAVPRQSG